MAASYNLVCKTCRVFLPMGNVFNVMENKEVPWQTSGILMKDEGRWHSQDAVVAKVLDRFLILHRNHDLTFVSDYVLHNILSAQLGTIQWVTGDEVLRQELNPTPDPVAESAAWITRCGSAPSSLQ